MAKQASKSAPRKKPVAKAPVDPYAKIRSCESLSDLFDLRPEDQTTKEWQIWAAKGRQLAEAQGVAFGPK